MAETISNKPWSNFKESDFTPEQWKASCLIVRGDGSTKAQCSLPVREPDGTLNKNACVAAAGALAGARGGVNATPEEKAKASTTLRRLYKVVGMEPPPSLMHTITSYAEAFLAHFGRKGMKWGIRRSDAQLAGGQSASADSPDAVRARETLSSIRSKGSLSAVSDADLNHLVNRINLEKRFDEIKPSAVEKGHNAIRSILKAGQTMNDAIKFANSPAGHLLSSSLGLTKAGKHATPVSQLMKAGGKKKKK